MIPWSHALLVSAVVLCALRDAVLSQRARCAGNQCVAFFQEPEDFPGARTRCKDSGGQLYRFNQEHVGELVTARDGSYWVELPSSDAAAEGALTSCPAISVSTGGRIELQRAPCRGTRNAFLCQYAFEEPCGVLQPGAGAQVTYTTTPSNFTVHDSDAFPPGTIAVTVKVGGVYLDAKHVCLSGGWMAAPWSCEVLRGGCEQLCAAGACACPPGKVLHRNNINCTRSPCEDHPCTGEGEECEPTRDGFRCACGEGFVEEDGACVDVAICERCEHMLCDKLRGVYQCTCRKGFRVAAHDPTKCELFCAEKDCPARCDGNDRDTCRCPLGFILDRQTVCTDIDECDMGQCHHGCENRMGGYQCLCNKGFELHRDGNTCVRIAGEQKDDGSGFSPPPPPRHLQPGPASARPAAVPPYVKTGSVLGIGVFVLLVAVLLCFLVRNAAKRCGRFELTSIKHRDIDIFYLQQGTGPSETYTRLSPDKLFRSDS
ncbi:thrombomodulin-like [Clinocottus analis]|uniref:thrombomodulin-like n=1 Tax=Clinocottus analis TaxID=304258 RepID=UPI0035BF0B4A